MPRKIIRFVLFVSCMFSVACQAEQTPFQATLDASGVISRGMINSTSTGTGVGEFLLNTPPGGPVTLDYRIELPDFDLLGDLTPDPLDNVTGVHLHDTTKCIPGMTCDPGDTAFTVHVMNIWGFPRGGDDNNDLVVDAPAHTLTGRWDDSDANVGMVDVPTLPISDPDVLSLLMNGQMALMVHTEAYPDAAIGGFLRVVPEPTSLSWLALLLLGRRRRG